jgi:hypothetical protein
MAMLELHSIEGAAACWRAAVRTSELAALEAIDMAGGSIGGSHGDGWRCCSSSSFVAAGVERRGVSREIGSGDAFGWQTFLSDSGDGNSRRGKNGSMVIGGFG